MQGDLIFFKEDNAEYSVRWIEPISCLWYIYSLKHFCYPNAASRCFSQPVQYSSFQYRENAEKLLPMGVVPFIIKLFFPPGFSGTW